VTARDLPPAIVLGGRNALSVVQSLGRAGVRVFVPAIEDNVRLRASRYARMVPIAGGEAPWHERLAEWLLGPEAAPLHGAVILASNDPGVEALARHRDALLPLYRLDLCRPAAQLAMLDKLETYRLARQAGVDAPAWWAIDDEAGLEEMRAHLRFPLIVKPRSSAAFQRRYPGGRKHLRAATFDEARAAVRTMREADLPFILVEFVPGPDDRGSALFTYLEEGGEPAFVFTKRFLRRSPPHEGEACYLVSEWVPEVVEPAMRLLRHVGLVGLAQVEFKLDRRDGRLKLIECNGRFIGPNPLLVASGLDLAPWIYRRALGRPAESLPAPRRGVRLWDPRRDYAAYRAMAAAGEMTWWGWLRSLRPARTFWFRLDDPMPTLVHAWRVAVHRVRRLRPGRRRGGPVPGEPRAEGAAPDDRTASA
jgi:predicted ATP-grasp superfamily ATP-dependent carboligase